jgi:outer membrane protein OmpA-like peptidoglycan-associated protein
MQPTQAEEATSGPPHSGHLPINRVVGSSLGKLRLGGIDGGWSSGTGTSRFRSLFGIHLRIYPENEERQAYWIQRRQGCNGMLQMATLSHMLRTTRVRPKPARSCSHQEKSMKPSGLFAPAFLLAIVTSPAASQRAGTLEFGAYAQATYFEESIRFERGSGGGGIRFGFFPLPHLELEAEGAFVPTEGPGGLDVSYIPLRARLQFNVPVGEHGALLVGGGYVRNEFGRDLDTHEDGITGLLGARLGLPGSTSIRLSTYIDYIPSPSLAFYPGATLDPDYNVNWGIQAGLSFLLGGRRATAQRREAVRPVRPDSLAILTRDSLARAARADSLRLQAARDSVAQAARAQQQRLRDSVRMAEQRANERQQALRDSLQMASRDDSIRTAALRDSLRLTQNRARIAAIRDSLARMALRDSLRLLMAHRETRVTLRGVNFELGKAVLLPISRDILEEVARSLVTNPQVRVEIGGHTDSTGSVSLNERLSLARAESVKAFLVENGVAADRMEVRGYASTQPVASNKTVSGRAQNRRVELRRID